MYYLADGSCNEDYDIGDSFITREGLLVNLVAGIFAERPEVEDTNGIQGTVRWENLQPVLAEYLDGYRIHYTDEVEGIVVDDYVYIKDGNVFDGCHHVALLELHTVEKITYMDKTVWVNIFIQQKNDRILEIQAQLSALKEELAELCDQ